MYPYIVIVKYYYESDIDAYHFRELIDLIDFDINTIIEYTNYNKTHIIKIKSKKLNIANDILEKVKILIQKEKKIIIHDIIWECSLIEKMAAMIISEWCLERLYNPHTKIGRKHISKYYNDCL